jgi:hypothetical protein
MNWKKQQRKIAKHLLGKMLVSNHPPTDPAGTAVREANKLMIALQVDNAKEREAA